MKKIYIILFFIIIIFSIFSDIKFPNKNMPKIENANIIEIDSKRYEYNNVSRNKIRESSIIEEELNNDEVLLLSLKILSNGSNKTYMDIKCITDKSSKQYDYIYNKKMIKICDDGLLKTDDDFIGVALGSYFGNIGDKFIFELDSGIKLQLIKIEAKSDKHTYEGFYHKKDKSVIEFVIDVNKVKNGKYKELLYHGNFNYHEDFAGNIINIWKIN